MVKQSKIGGQMQLDYVPHKRLFVSVLVGMVIVSVGTACNETASSNPKADAEIENQSFDSPRKQSNAQSQDMKRRNSMTTEMLAQELQRARVLLSQANEPLQEVDPELPPENIGALGGIGFEVKNPDVKLSIYVFEYQNQHADAVEKLMAQVPQEGTRILHGSNGSLLFFGHTRTDGPDGIDAKFRLGGLASAFAGQE